MGSSASTPVTINNDDKHQWPDNMYVELRDMSALSFLIHGFGYASDVVRRSRLAAGSGGKKAAVFQGLEWDENAKQFKKTRAPTINLARSFTPQEVLDLILANRKLLAKQYPSIFGNNQYFKMMQHNLVTLQEEIDAARASSREDGTLSSRPFTLEEYDDRHQKHELVYGITKDEINKRVTIIFRGTNNEFSFGTNWSTNLRMRKRFVPTSGGDHTFPKVVQDTAPKGLRFHSGFYNYIFGLTKDEDDDKSWRKYDEILQDVKTVLQQCPGNGRGYKIYVTGHSLGAALASMLSIFLACEPDVPKPVTCIHFASPRIGDFHVRSAVRALERNGTLRMLRVWNNNDTVAVVPITRYYHVGIHLRLFRWSNAKPEIVYPSPNEAWSSTFHRVWSNSVISSFNARYDHSDYRQRIEKAQAFLMGQDLRALYKDESFMKFDA